MRDSLDTLICPACGRKMHKIKAPHEDLYIDICLDGCGGIFFDNRELEKFDEEHENIDFILELMKDKTFIKVDESEKRICPYCEATMVKNYTSAQHEAQIDCCYDCGGKFLDYGELEKIRNQFKTEKDRSSDFINHFMDEFGENIYINEQEAAKLKKQRSLLKKLFLAIYDRS